MHNTSVPTLARANTCGVTEHEQEETGGEGECMCRQILTMVNVFLYSPTGPVQFEKEEDDDVFGLDKFFTEAKKGKKTDSSSTLVAGSSYVQLSVGLLVNPPSPLLPTFPLLSLKKCAPYLGTPWRMGSLSVSPAANKVVITLAFNRSSAANLREGGGSKRDRVDFEDSGRDKRGRY